MFLFYHSGQSADNASYHQGILFENVITKYLRLLGYGVTLNRIKKNGSEYDIQGIHSLDGRKVIGEAKAYTKTISIDIFQQFVGKSSLFLRKGNTTGLFVSTSPLTADANDFYQEIADEFNIKAICGTELENDVRNKLGLPSSSAVELKLEDHELSIFSEHLLCTDSGEFVLCICILGNAANPSCFTIINKKGQLVNDAYFSKSLFENVSILADYTPFQVDEASRRVYSERIIGSGLTVSNAWHDYRSPAAPQYFVGRDLTIEYLYQYINNNDDPTIVQIKSRSGVGKSSLVAYLGEFFKNRGIEVDIHDARDIKSQVDILYVIGRACKTPSMPRDWSEAEQLLLSFEAARSKPFVFFVDQFESTFLAPEIYEGYEQLALILERNNLLNTYVVFARKNDLMTTYDTRKIDLDRLNSISKSITLQDFEPDEAWLLIDNISKAFGKPVSRNVKIYVLEFAQGFPWLIKRTMAHILKLIEEGYKQNRLFSTALRLDELFEEELSVLDEIERSYLLRMASKLPADYQQLEREFDEDPKLPEILAKLTQARLIRLSGSTYDTYNDVFKEYLVFQRLPDFRQATLYRQTPGSVLSFLKNLADIDKFDIQTASTISGTNEKSTYNKLAELKNLNLIKQAGGMWYVPQYVKDSYNRGFLGQNLRQNMLSNALVSDLIGVITAKKFISLSEITDFIRSKFPYTSASSQTWSVYTSNLVAWLMVVKLIKQEEEGIFSIVDDKRSDIFIDLGNLTIPDTRRSIKHRTHGAFIPTIQFGAFLDTIEMFRNGYEVNYSKTKKVQQVLQRIGLKIENLHNATDDEIIGRLTQYFKGQEISNYWDKVNNGENPQVALGNLISDDSLKDSTAKIYTKTLMGWGRGLGLTQVKWFGNQTQ